MVPQIERVMFVMDVYAKWIELKKAHTAQVPDIVDIIDSELGDAYNLIAFLIEFHFVTKNSDALRKDDRSLCVVWLLFRSQSRPSLQNGLSETTLLGI